MRVRVVQVDALLVHFIGTTTTIHRRLEVVTLRLQLPMWHNHYLLLKRVLPRTVVPIEILYVLLVVAPSYQCSALTISLVRRHTPAKFMFFFIFYLFIILFILLFDVRVTLGSVELVRVCEDRITDVSPWIVQPLWLVSENPWFFKGLTLCL
jgi:hypothetical protein